ncbi:conserved hypothetical protein [Aeropyrum pernix K1]|uniref:Lysine transporter LysE n=1 Tax=Aeropyrum pernix (strain ATCC 700893 / DSM 11879 / JCM 9820 / NBRC 100138 / K1) TaxID=272557 RepID=Q9Y9A8_AERPE|nr:LysE family translocator [Aeropyrum pernix]BAA81392.1 conserved hypothetical protein [Aeropyrum pernix K1]
MAGEEGGLARLAVRTVIITPSGALSPGPLSLSAIVAGAYLGWIGGVFVALGHMAFELPFVLLLLKASSSIERHIKKLYRPLTTAISLFIIYFSLLSFDAALKGPEAGGNAIPLEPASYSSAFIIGVVLTGFNAHFLLWWVSVGFPLITGAARNPPLGPAIMYASHVWMDFVWLALLAGMGDVASQFAPAYKALMALVGLMLLLFALDLMARAWLGRRVLPL